MLPEKKISAKRKNPVTPPPHAGFRNRILYGALTLISLGFTAFGVQVLRMAYYLEEPGYFILFFFAANFIILFSLTFALIFILRLRAGNPKS